MGLQARGVLRAGRHLVGGGPLQLAVRLPAGLVGGERALDGGPLGGGHRHRGERALAHGDGRRVVDGGVVRAVRRCDLDLGLGGLLGRRLVGLGLRGAASAVGGATVAAGTRREHQNTAEQGGRGHQTSTPPTVRHHTLLHRCRLQNPESPRQKTSTLRPVRPVPHFPKVWGTPRSWRGWCGCRFVRLLRRRNPGGGCRPGSRFPKTLSRCRPLRRPTRRRTPHHGRHHRRRGPTPANPGRSRSARWTRRPAGAPPRAPD